jgi:hypothetical protein
VQLGAKHGLHFYDTRFSDILLPDAIDSGHVPVFGMYLAFIWLLFGKSLLVSHFAMLPFLLGIVFQSFYIIKRYIPQHFLSNGLFLFLIEPTLLGQSVLISPDIPLVFFFLLALNSVLYNHRVLLGFGILSLFLISMRGGMISFAILLLDLYFNFKKTSSKPFWNLVRMSWSYLPGFIMFCLYNYLHFVKKGWIGYHIDSPWAISFQHVGFEEFLKNIVILGWRLLDFGRIFLWLAAIWLAIKYFPKVRKDEKIKELVVIFMVLLISLSFSFLTYKGLSAHRYILPVYLSFSLVVIYMIFLIIPVKKIWKWAILCIGLISGHFWVYPSHISQGWDASLAHIHYYEIRQKMLDDMKTHNIALAEVACVFPNNSEQKFMDLSNITTKHSAFDHSNSRYVLYSNVYNDFTDEDIKVIAEKYKELSHRQKMGVFITLYERKK